MKSFLQLIFCNYFSEIEVSTALREGGTLLHRFSFNILASICDGVSENINFIYASVQLHLNNPESSHIGLN